MPIVFVHGVRVRNDGAFREVEPLLRRHVAPRLRPGDSGAVAIEHAYWGDLGVTWAWNMASRPRGVLGQGVAGSVSPLELVAATEAGGTLHQATDAVEGAVAPAGVLTMGGAGGAERAVTPLRELGSDELADTLMAFIEAEAGKNGPNARPAVDGFTTLAAADVAAAPPELGGVSEREQLGALVEHTLVRAAALRRAAAGDGVAAQGGGAEEGGVLAQGGFGDFVDRVKETFGRAVSAPGYVLSRGVGELRFAVHGFVADFTGDVFVYLDRRGKAGAPGPIPKRFLDAVERARAASSPGEPLVVLTHSMGGQIAYDAFTTFAPQLEVAFWASAGSQVAFFEEAKLFLASNNASGGAVRQATPPKVAAWWNVWDPNDIVSFTGADIFKAAPPARFVDQAFVTGAGLALAHVSYFKRPSFWSALVGQMEAAGL